MTGLEVSLAAQLRAFFAALLLGILLGMLYDAFFILRALLGADTGERGKTRLAERQYPLLPSDFAKREKGRVGRGADFAVTAILDFLYALLFGFCLLLFTYWQSEGVFRLYYLVAAALGFSSYYLTFGRLVASSAAAIVFLIRLFLAYLCLFIRVPTVKLCLFLRRVLFSLFLFLFSPLYGSLVMAQKKRIAERGFLPSSFSLS